MNSMIPPESLLALRDSLYDTDITFPDEQFVLLHRVLDWYMERVQTFNFTGHKDLESFVWKNMVDSLLPIGKGYMSFSSGENVADIGTGGGFPGVPLACVSPDLKFSLYDSVGKKIRLIQELAKEMGLPHVYAEQTRLEELGQSDIRESFDVVVSKALAHYTTLLEYALPLLKLGGRFYAYQGPQILEEYTKHQETLSMLGGEVTQVHEYDLRGDPRVLLEIRKVGETPLEYPRGVGVPKKQPL